MNPLKKGIVAGAVVASALTGGAVGAALINGSAGAADNDTQSSAAAPDPSQGGHQANGITEELLTGDTAAKVTAAAKEAVPDGTIQRVETDAEGSPYEAHVTKSDGTRVTVKVDSDFNVTAVEDGPSGPPGQAPAADGNA